MMNERANAKDSAKANTPPTNNVNLRDKENSENISMSSKPITGIAESEDPKTVLVTTEQPAMKGTSTKNVIVEDKVLPLKTTSSDKENSEERNPAKKIVEVKDETTGSTPTHQKQELQQTQVQPETTTMKDEAKDPRSLKKTNSDKENNDDDSKPPKFNSKMEENEHEQVKLSKVDESKIAEQAGPRKTFSNPTETKPGIDNTKEQRIAQLKTQIENQKKSKEPKMEKADSDQPRETSNPSGKSSERKSAKKGATSKSKPKPAAASKAKMTKAKQGNGINQKVKTTKAKQEKPIETTKNDSDDDIDENMPIPDTLENVEDKLHNLKASDNKDLQRLLSPCRELIVMGQGANAFDLADKAAKLAAEVAIDVYERVTVEEYDERVQQEAGKGFVSPSGLASQRLRGIQQRKWDTNEDRYLKKRQISETRRRKKECLAELMYWNQMLVGDVGEEKKDEQMEETNTARKKAKDPLDEIIATTSVCVGSGRKKKKEEEEDTDNNWEEPKQPKDAPKDPEGATYTTQPTQEEDDEEEDSMAESEEKKEESSLSISFFPTKKKENVRKFKKTTRKVAEKQIKEAHSCKRACLKQLLLTVKKKPPQKMYTMKQHKKAAALIQEVWRGWKEMRKLRSVFMREKLKAVAGKQSRLAIAKRQERVRKLNQKIAAQERENELAMEELTSSLATTRDDVTQITGRTQGTTVAYEKNGCNVIDEQVEADAQQAIFSFTDGCTNFIESLGWWNDTHQITLEVGHNKNNEGSEEGGFNQQFLTGPNDDDTHTKGDTTLHTGTLGGGETFDDDSIIEKYAGPSGPTTFRTAAPWNYT